MTDAQLLHRQDLVVELDYGQFYLYTAEFDPDLVEEVLDRALEGEGIAQSDGVLVVESPHQNNFEMPLAIEIWTAASADDLTEWQEAFEAHLEVSDAGLTYESPTVDLTNIDVPPGSYHALITGRGFVGRGWPGSTEPGDEWRIRLWPSAGPSQPRRLVTDAGRPFDTPRPELRAAGVQAVRRLHEELNGGHRLSGERGRVVVERRIPGNRHQLFDDLRNPSGWLTQQGSGNETRFVLRARRHDNESFVDANRIVPRDGMIDGRLLEAKAPSYALSSWTWRRGRADPGPLRQDDERLGIIVVPPDPQMTLRVDLEAAPKEDGLPTTVVRITHDFVPREWVDDLTAYWRWMLERADYEFDLGNVRRKNPNLRLRIRPVS